MRRCNPTREGIAQSKLRVTLMQRAERRRLGIWAFACRADRVAARAVALDERFATADEGIDLARQRRLRAETLQTVGRAGEAAVQHQCLVEVGDGLGFAALQFVYISAIVVSERICRIERNGRRVVADGLFKITFLAVREPAVIEGAGILRIEMYRLRKVRYRGIRVALQEICVPATDEERRVCRLERDGGAKVFDRAGDVIAESTGLARGRKERQRRPALG